MSDSTTISARRPGAIWPRSFRLNASAPERNAARQKRAMAALKQPQLGYGGEVAVDHTGVIHEFSQPDAGGMAHERHKVFGLYPGTGGW